MNNLRVLLLFLALFPLPAQAAHVVVTIKPIHSLVAGLLEGVDTPELLLKGTASPHSFHPKPSDVKKLMTADKIIMVDNAMEHFLTPFLRSIAPEKVVMISKSPNIRLQKMRERNEWGEQDAHHDHDHEHSSYDYHLWLDPQNAIAVVGYLEQELVSVYPDKQDKIHNNYNLLLDSLKVLDKDMERRTATLKDKPFAVFHDAYTYLEARYGLKVVGVVSVPEDHGMSAKHLQGLKTSVQQNKAVCLFSEPQFDQKIVKSLADELHIRHSTLDPLGASLPEGKDAYTQMLTQIATQLGGCLQ